MRKNPLRPTIPPQSESGTEGVKGACPLEEASCGASIPAEAGTHESRPLLKSSQAHYAISVPLPEGVAQFRPLAKRGNPTIQIPPLYYNPEEHAGWIYIVANKPDGIIYIGQTANLPKRIFDHKEGKIPGFTKIHGCKTLVYFEGYAKITDSIDRETAMKEWPRKWKIKRILQTNPTWRDLYADVCTNQ